MRLRPLAICIGAMALLALGCGSSEEATKPTPAAGPEFVPVDFQSLANGNEVENLPLGPQTFQGVEYHIGQRPLQLGGASSPQFPPAIAGIAIGKTCRAIHFLHASQGGGYQQPGHPKHEHDGVETGRYLMHYADGTEAVQPIVYGEHLRDWWDWDGNLPTPLSQVVWTGENARSREFKRKIRLYWAVWENPHPEKPITSLDFVSTNAKAAPFCVAISLELTD